MHISHRHQLAGGSPAAASEGQRGYTMVMTALLLVPLLLLAGFSIDVGGWYNRTNEIQRAADAAALAGVVWLPNIDLARQYALEAAERNGFVDGQDNISVSVDQVGDRRLRVTITDGKVESAIYQSLTRKTMVFTRKATAEYILPVPLGSPENRLGNDPTTGYAPNLWASISAPYADKNNGDPYSTKCGNGSANTGCAQTNTEYRTTGYLYVVDVPASAVGKTLTLSIYDAGMYARANYANVETADNGAVNTQFEFFKADDTPLNTDDNLDPSNSMSGKCSVGPGKQYIANNTMASTFENKWWTLCQVTASKAGQWFLQVKSSDIAGVTDAGTGWNQFSLKATLSGSVQPTLYTIGDLSLFNNLPGQSGTFNATFYLAKIDQIHAGKTLQISLFDPGDGASGNYFLNLLAPGGASSTCKYGARGASQTTISPCRIQTRSGLGSNYNGQWLDISVVLPNNYTCSTDCWWKVKYEFVSVAANQSPNDRTVWAARVIGDPVHLVEEGT